MLTIKPLTDNGDRRRTSVASIYGPCWPQDHRRRKTPCSLNVDSFGVTLMLSVLTVVSASGRMENFYDANYEDYYPTLFRRDHREFFVSVDHRHIYCDCRSVTFTYLFICQF